MIGSDLLLIFVAGGLLVALAVMVSMSVVRARRRRIEISQPFPPHWRSLLDEQLPLYRRLPAELRASLEPLVRGFLADIEFVGCQGFEITDEVRLIISTQACLLIVGYGLGAYEALRSVLVYPDEFVVEERDEDEAGVVTEGERALSGQTFETARIILSWRDVLESGSGKDIYNVVLHEFAHHLDHSVGGTLSAPASNDVLEREYEALCDAVDRGEETLIDPYGAEHMEEFFAVATETFFEAPELLREWHPRLYDELRRVYRLNPVEWSDAV